MSQNNEKQIKELLQNLENRDGWVRSKAASRLGKLKVKEAVSTLTKLLYEDKDSLVRSHAAAALGELRAETKDIVIALVETVKRDPTISVRLKAINALGNIGSKEAIKELTDIALNDKDIRLRSWAADALRKITI